MTHTQPAGLKPGVYLGLSNEAYHADPALGSTGCKRLIPSPLDYWWNSPLNPTPDEELGTTPAKKFGSAYHTYVLEPSLFKYDIVDGKTTTKEGCLTRGEHKKILAMDSRIQKVPEHAQLFKNGFAEVSVFWRDEETGLMCKCRFNYMRLKWITDLKTCSDSNRRALYYDFPKYGYDISAALYMEGSAQLKRMLKAGTAHISGGEAFREFLNVEGERFVFFFQCKEAPYIARALPMADDIANVGREKFRKALGIYQDNLARHGVTEEWDLGFPAFEDLTLNDVSDSINYF